MNGPGWVPCEWRLPESEDYYIITWVDDDEAYSGEAYYTEEGWMWNEDGGGYIPSVTAWMPLPKPWEGKAVGPNAGRDNSIYHERTVEGKTFKEISQKYGLSDARCRHIVWREARRSGLPDGFPIRAFNALKRAGIYPEETRTIPDEDLMELRGIGPVALGQIRAFMGKEA